MLFWVLRLVKEKRPTLLILLWVSLKSPSCDAMECLELNLNNEIGDCSGGGGGGGGGSGGVGGGCGGNPNLKGGGDGFIDRSKVRILLCDNNGKSSEEVLTLLLKCSYQGIIRICYLHFGLLLFHFLLFNVWCALNLLSLVSIMCYYTLCKYLIHVCFANQAWELLLLFWDFLLGSFRYRKHSIFTGWVMLYWIKGWLDYLCCRVVTQN